MNDLYDFAPELGLPSKTELMQYIEYAQNMDYATKFLLFLLVICIEKASALPCRPLPPPIPLAVHRPPLPQGALRTDHR